MYLELFYYHLILSYIYSLIVDLSVGVLLGNHLSLISIKEEFQKRYKSLWTKKSKTFQNFRWWRI